MTKEEVMKLVSDRLRLIRQEQGYSQDVMAEVLGTSKKTLVQIEKNRVLASWTVTVATCSLFSESEVLQHVLGNEPLEVIKLIAHKKMEHSVDKTMGGKVWWKDVEQKGRYVLQQNLISKHYRILDDDQFRWFSSFDRDEGLKRLDELNGE
ncbi:helix-turn-helix domain-containing protein [Alkalihalobacillus sp. R86527]|uniref:helix-turn-helix domain-containing protein n=1 Tax=Alkalihalobacillus sp. R86527 TaxID=3093863 RepID=UPI003672691A